MSIPRRPLQLSISLVKLALIFLLTSLAFGQQPTRTLCGQACFIESVRTAGLTNSAGGGASPSANRRIRAQIRFNF